MGPWASSSGAVYRQASDAAAPAKVMVEARTPQPALRGLSWETIQPGAPHAIRLCALLVDALAGHECKHLPHQMLPLGVQRP